MGQTVTLQYLSRDGRPAPAVRAAAIVRPAATAPFANGKIPAARPGNSVEFRLVREENGNALPGDRARRARPGAIRETRSGGGSASVADCSQQCSPSAIVNRQRIQRRGVPAATITTTAAPARAATA